jgi:hypothetical protein
MASSETPGASVRFTYNLFVVGLLGAILAWVDRAPHDPLARAAYLCKPVQGAARAAIALQGALGNDGAVEPAIDPWRFHPGASCERLILRMALTSD